ncbi:MAG: hypothetical protein HY078_11695 [Elusimicrobia bacterium]|nr:hypothetical protein [Elusimicrobiota bacterium]
MTRNSWNEKVAAIAAAVFLSGAAYAAEPIGELTNRLGKRVQSEHEQRENTMKARRALEEKFGIKLIEPTTYEAGCQCAMLEVHKDGKYVGTIRSYYSPGGPGGMENWTAKIEDLFNRKAREKLELERRQGSERQDVDCVANPRTGIQECGRRR